MACVQCGDSGVVNVFLTIEPHANFMLVDPTPHASYCHACPAGEVWREAGLE